MTQGSAWIWEVGLLNFGTTGDLFILTTALAPQQARPRVCVGVQLIIATWVQCLLKFCELSHPCYGICDLSYSGNRGRSWQLA